MHHFTIEVLLFSQIPSVNGESISFNAGEESNRDVEPVAREMKGREAINIVDLYKTFHGCRKPEVKAVNGGLNKYLHRQSLPIEMSKLYCQA